MAASSTGRSINTMSICQVTQSTVTTILATDCREYKIWGHVMLYCKVVRQTLREKDNSLTVVDFLVCVWVVFLTSNVQNVKKVVVQFSSKES